MTNALSRSIEHLIAVCVRLGVDSGMDLSRMIGDVVTLAKAEEREACALVAEDPRFANAPAWERPSLIAYWIRARGSK